MLESAEDSRFSARRPVREGNRVEVLVDGEEALPAMSATIAGARSHVHIAGWHSSPEFRLTREPGAPTLRELLGETAERVPVRLLLWAGPPVPAFQHPADRSIGWHDMTMRVEGPIVADVAEHFRRCWTEVAEESLPEPKVQDPAGTSNVQFVRTVPEKTHAFAPRGEFTIVDTYLRALRSAKRLVYLENQFLWSPEVAEILIGKLKNPPADDFRVVLVLPRKPSNGADTTRGQLGRLLDADDDGRRLLATTLTSHDGDNETPVYVHAKLGIVDDEWMTVGSANLNEHSLFNDSEANLVTDDVELIRDTRLKLWAEHLQRSKSEVDGDPAKVVDELWRPIAEKDRPNRLTLLPSVSRRAAGYRARCADCSSTADQAGSPASRRCAERNRCW
ncbi:phospholipase D family protein [Amycolatopsis sp.]|uniref:phospholipase D-like domain-containing protein n=1 Tax=Amycolatopsis sp. TaxID=37632 RepID=UPI002DF9593D|nr:phospholipase D family protein [Amycolatopsis sp.]